MKTKVITFLQKQIGYYDNRLKQLIELLTEISATHYVTQNSEKLVDCEIRLNYYRDLLSSVQSLDDDGVNHCLINRIIMLEDHLLQQFIPMNTSNPMKNMIAIWENEISKRILKELKSLV
jgi:hypothetical protein